VSVIISLRFTLAAVNNFQKLQTVKLQINVLKINVFFKKSIDQHFLQDKYVTFRFILMGAKM